MSGRHDDRTFQAVPANVFRGEATVWLNPHRAASAEVLPTLTVSRRDVEEAAARWIRFAPLLKRLFPELKTGVIDSPLLQLSTGTSSRITWNRDGAAVWVKADHDLPVTGCIKARGGVYEVLVYTDRLASQTGLLRKGDTSERLLDQDVRDFFATHTVAVGSTGNLGFSVGVIARALGFKVEVHMSHDAKGWKKSRLRHIGAIVVEHPGDYASAVAAARASFADKPHAYFVDDEDSIDLFLGYATAAFDLQRQLVAAGIPVDPDHPLYVYLPCGVGGAPGGVTFGLKLLFGDAVRCVFVEPVASPCMLVQLASGLEHPVSIYEVGLDGRTAADGLAVSNASMLVARNVGQLTEAVVTVTDDDLFAWIATMWAEAGLRLEPSAASGFAAVGSFLAAEPARPSGRKATHVVWTTGGALLPESEFEEALARADRARAERGNGQ